MKLGLHLARLTAPGGDVAAYGPALAATARAADESGFRDVTLMDHWFQMEMLGGPGEPMLEGYTTLGYLAACTERVRLGLLVTGVTYRHPGLLAKTVTTLDVLSGGRARLGIGAAWYEREHVGLGVPFPSLTERFERLEETLAICHPDVERRRRPLRRAALRAGRDGLRAATGAAAAAADHGRRERREEDAAPRRAVRRRLQPVRDHARRGGRTSSRCCAGHCADLGRDPGEIEKTMLIAGDPLADVDRFVDAAGGVRRGRDRDGGPGCPRPRLRSLGPRGRPPGGAAHRRPLRRPPTVD